MSSQVAKLIILFETNVTQDEIRAIYGLFSDATVKVCAIDDRYLSSRAEDLKYNVILADMRIDNVKQWVIDQKSWILSNSETVKCVYKHKSGCKIPEDEMKLIKNSFGCTAIRKHLPEEARDFQEYVKKVLNDHVSSTVVKLSWVEWLIKLIAKYVCA